MPNLTAKLARHIVGYRSAGLDRAALTVAKQCVLDWYGVTLAGSNEPVARILREEIATSGQGSSSIVGFNLRCSPVDAALINGATSHALDYDDVHPLIGHPTAAVLPAVLSIAEAKGRSGMDVLRAFIAGYEAAGFVGSLVMRSHYERGFHSTATVGSFGAAAAAGLLLDLDEAQMAIALGLAGTQAAGLKSMFGTMAKPFHAGRAAANGVLAARLAARGFTANPGVLEVAQGFVATQSDGDPSADMPLPRRGQPGRGDALQISRRLLSHPFQHRGDQAVAPAVVFQRSGCRKHRPPCRAGTFVGLQHRLPAERARNQVQPAPHRGPCGLRQGYGCDPDLFR